MFDIIVNGQVVAIAAESVVKLFMNALINALPTEVSIISQHHAEPEVEQVEKTVNVKKTTSGK